MSDSPEQIELIPDSTVTAVDAMFDPRFSDHFKEVAERQQRLRDQQKKSLNFSDDDDDGDSEAIQQLQQQPQHQSPAQPVAAVVEAHVENEQQEELVQENDDARSDLSPLLRHGTFEVAIVTQEEREAGERNVFRAGAPNELFALYGAAVPRLGGESIVSPQAESNNGASRLPFGAKKVEDVVSARANASVFLQPGEVDNCNDDDGALRWKRAKDDDDHHEQQQQVEFNDSDVDLPGV